ncbi:MAG: TAXI family TRAP transporter solute-binding subunit [Pseudomonadota bacterium]
MKRRTIGAVTGAAIVALAAPAIGQAQEFISIGTGGVTGVYYPTGGAVCRLVNKDRKDHGIRCSVESTGGSVYNINTVRSGELEFGVAQSDWQFHSLHGTSEFESQGPFDGLRAVFSIHPEPFTVIALNDSGIETFEDVKGKRVNIGNPGSGTRATAEVVLDAYGMSVDDLALAGELKGSEMAAALCDGKMDAIVYVIGHPAAAINEASTTCDVHLVDVTGEPIDKLIDENSYFRTATIPGGMYKGTDEDTTTFGVGATLVSSADVPEDSVYVLVKAVFDNFDDFKQLHPAFANLNEEEMISEALSAPLHPGAEKYYKERGWM